MMITRELLRRWNACYSDDKISGLVPERGLTPLEVADRTDVPVDARIWVLLRPDVLGDAAGGVVDRIVEDAIRCMLGRSGVPAWESWAQSWLAGDRDASAAWAASDAAGAAARDRQLAHIRSALVAQG